MAAFNPPASSSRHSLPLSTFSRPRTPSIERISQSNGPKITRQSSISSNHSDGTPNPLFTRNSSTSNRPLSPFQPPVSPRGRESDRDRERITTNNGPVITRIQSVMGEPPVLGSRRPISPPPPSSRSLADAHPRPRSADQRGGETSDSEQEELARDRGGRGSLERAESRLGLAQTSTGSLPRFHHARDQTSESTTASSLRTHDTTWNGGFTPKASQDPLILHNRPQASPAPSTHSAAISPAGVVRHTSRHGFEQQLEPAEPASHSGFDSSPSALTRLPAPRSQSIQISQPFTKIPSTPVLSSQTRKPLKRYSLHQGSNRFFLSGLLVTSRDNPWPFLASLGIAAALPALWVAFVGRGLWENERGHALGRGGKGSVIVFAYLTLVVWSSMLKASLSDPGILPRGLDESPQRKYVDAETVDPATGEKVPGQFVAETKYLRVRDGVVGSKWCETCEIYRPPRTSHCRLCDNCVELTDHHCAFLNNCIGRRNYFPFLAFLSSANLLLVYAIAFTAYFVSLTPPSPAHWDSVGSYILLALLVAVAVPVGGLGAYHARLVWKNRTTIEMLRPKSSRGGLNPSTGEAISNLFELSSPAKNCLSVWCRPGLGYGGRGGWREPAARDARDGASRGTEGQEESRDRMGKEGV